MNSIKKIKERKLEDRKKREFDIIELHRFRIQENKRLKKSKELAELAELDKIRLLEGSEICEDIKEKKHKNIYYEMNREHLREYQKKYREENIGHCKELAWKFNGIILTFNKYQEMYKSQEGKCKICGSNINLLKDKNDKFNRLTAHVDHDHVTGNIRGLLCNYCNNGLGRFKDNLQLLKNAVKYINSPISIPNSLILFSI